MEDKRRRARVQGAWASSAKGQAGAPPAKRVCMTSAWLPRVCPGCACTPVLWPRETPTAPWSSCAKMCPGSRCQASVSWLPVLRELKGQIEANTGHRFNSLLCNLYRDERDSVDWHSDDEPALGPQPVIASLSLGATRTFEMRKKPPPEEDGDYTYMETVRIPLSHGTLLLMEGATQADWQHRVPKEYHSREPRVNLTFRTIYPDPKGSRP